MTFNYVPCECMIIEDELGQSVCKQCRGDWYGCECPIEHSITCPKHEKNQEE